MAVAIVTRRGASPDPPPALGWHLPLTSQATSRIEWSHRRGRCGGRTVPPAVDVPGRLRCRLHTIRPSSPASRFREGRLLEPQCGHRPSKCGRSWRSTSPTLRSIQVSPVPTKGVPELACPVLKSLQTLGLAVVGSGRSQPQHGEFANLPASHCRSSQNPVDGRDVLSDLRSLLRCTIRNVIGCRRRRLRQLSPNRQEYAGSR